MDGKTQQAFGTIDVLVDSLAYYPFTFLMRFPWGLPIKSCHWWWSQHVVKTRIKLLKHAFLLVWKCSSLRNINTLNSCGFAFINNCLSHMISVLGSVSTVLFWWEKTKWRFPVRLPERKQSQFLHWTNPLNPIQHPKALKASL